MKKNKILAAIGAAAASAVIMGGGANATPVSITTDSNGIVTNTDTIQVNNVTKSGDAFKACKIVDVKYDSTTNVISYEFTSAFNSVKSSLPQEFQSITISDYMGNDYASGTASGSAITGNTKIDRLAGALASNSSFVSSCTNMTTSSTSPYSASSTVAWGGYLIIPQGNSNEMTDAYGAMIANLTAQADGSGYNVDTTHAVVNAKKSAAGSVQKTTNQSGSFDNSFAIGETYQYVVTAVYPTYPSNATNKKFIVTDTPEAGVTLDSVSSIVAGGTTLTIDGNNIKNGTNTVGTISNSNGTITFTFNDVSALGGANNNIIITYDAHLNSNATLGDGTGSNSVNENSVTIQTPRNPYDTSSSWETSDPETSTVYTYGVKITKIKENDPTTKLQGAEFNLCLSSDTNCSNPLNGNTPITTDVNGEATYSGTLGDGTYYLKETKAPAGYRLAANQTVTVTVNSGASNLNNGYFEYMIEDPESIFNLPFTGGRGVVVYAILGVGIVGIASVFYYRKKKQQA